MYPTSSVHHSSLILHLSLVIMLKLYGGDRSRASIVKWYLEELAIP
ncbi:hypothetical protein [Plectonema radiosum]|nr:hypothetical protein [Plectonema radiosum]